MIEEVISIGFKTGLQLAMWFGFIGYIIGLAINLFEDYYK